jgi:hypothetical protein
MDSRDDLGATAVATPEAPATGVGPPAAPTRRSPRRMAFMLAGVGLAVVILVLAGAAANAALSQTYSARQAVLDYFGALARRDVDGVLANASYQRGEGAYSAFFGRPAIQGMLKLPANSDIHNVRITDNRGIDGSTRSVTVALTWNGSERSLAYTVRQDPARTHWLFFHSWRVEIPSNLIRVTQPNQPGNVLLDGIPTSTEGSTAIQAVPGFHRVSMDSTTLWDTATKDVDAVESNAAVTLDGTIRASALDAARQAVKEGFNSCDAAKYAGCFNHTYPAPDRNFIYYFTLPGYGNVDYAKYVVALRDDQTADMKMTVQADSGKVSVSGTCRETITVDGSRKYSLKGDWNGTLTLNGGGFDSDVTWRCDLAKG